MGRQRRPDLFEGKPDSWQSRSSQLANKETNEAVACKLRKDVFAFFALRGKKLILEESSNNCKIQYQPFQIYSCDLNYMEKHGISGFSIVPHRCCQAIDISISTFCLQAIKFGESAPDKLPLLGGDHHVQSDS